MRLGRIVLCVTAGALVLTGASSFPAAEDKAGSGKPSAGSDPYAAYRRIFRRLDADGDGNVTEPEAAAGAKRIFAEMDADGNGKVTIPEFLSARWKWQVDVKWTQRAPAPSATVKPPSRELQGQIRKKGGQGPSLVPRRR